MTVFRPLPALPGKDSYTEIRQTVNAVLMGKVNSTGEFSVRPGASQTVVSNRSIGEGSFVGIIGLDEHSFSDRMFILEKSVSSGTFTVGHDAVSFDRRYSYVILG